MNNIKFENNLEQLKIVFYFRNKETSYLIIINSLPRENGSRSESNVIYKFSFNVMT